MKNILLVCDKEIKLSFWAGVKKQNTVNSLWVKDAKQAFDQIEKDVFDVVVIQDPLPDMDGRSFVEKLIMKNPLQQCVVISSMPQKDFHDAFEGLGVLMQFPENPEEDNFIALEERLAVISGLTGGTTVVKGVQTP